MYNALLDSPLILSFLFHPRSAQAGTSRLDNVTDGTIPVDDDVVLGYRLYAHEPSAPVILFFHGNAEIAPDYEDIAPLYHHAGASLMIVDYRGYGWSTGRPLVSTLLSDMEAVHKALPDILSDAGFADSPLIVMGRSLGSACAIHLASQHPDELRGMVIESGFAHVVPLLSRLGLPIMGDANIPDPINNIGKMRSISLPLLIIHGESDTLIPVEEGQALYAASAAETKNIKRVRGAGHNDLLYYAEEYFMAMSEFIEQVAS